VQFSASQVQWIAVWCGELGVFDGVFRGLLALRSTGNQGTRRTGNKGTREQEDKEEG
jgi:hypothetical protein